MLLDWTKTLVGVVVTASFAVPLYTAVSDRQLHDVPMAVLAGNLSVSGLLVGVIMLANGIYNLAQLQWRNPCVLMQSFVIGSCVTFKFAHLCLAIDQFVAVVYPLRHYQRMARDLRWLLLATGIIWICFVIILLSTAWLGLETVSEAGHYNVTATDGYEGCIWHDVLANVGTRVVQATILVMSLISLCLLIFTGVIGLRTKSQLEKTFPQHPPDEATGHRRQRFFANFSMFKVTCAVLSLTYVSDMTVMMLLHYDKSMNLLNFIGQVRSMGFVIEGLAYGLLNTKMRAAYMKIFCANTRLAMLLPQNVPRRQQREVVTQHRGRDAADVRHGRNETARRSDLEMTAQAQDLGMDAQHADQDESVRDSSQDVPTRYPSEHIAVRDPEQDRSARGASQDMVARDLESDEADQSLERAMMDLVVGHDDPR